MAIIIVYLIPQFLKELLKERHVKTTESSVYDIF